MLANGIKQAATGAAGNLTVAVIGAYPTFASKYSVGANGDPFPYAIVRDSDGVGMEWGIGHLSDATTLVRDRIIESWSGSAWGVVPTDLTSGGTYTVMVADNSSVRAVAPVGSDTTIAATRYLVGGQWISNAAANILMVAGTAIIVPYRLDIPAIVSGISVKVTVIASAGTTMNMRAALYRMDKNGHMGNLVSESAAVSSTTTGVKSLLLPSSVRLVPGWYFIAVLADGNPSLVGTNVGGGAGHCPMWGVPAGDQAGRYVQATKVITYADTGACFPNPLGTTGLTYGADWSFNAICPTLMVTS